MRLDVWLDVACLCRTRSEAKRACEGGKISVNGESAAKAHRDVKVGDEIRLTHPYGRRQTVIVRGLAEQHIAKALARELYEDVTPPPSPEELETRRMMRLVRIAAGPQHSPDKRERRTLRRLQGKD
jgi:ribosome-associated heat shock protein Hsp15